MPKQVVLARFEPVVTHFGPWKTPKFLDNGPVLDQKWVKNGSKACVSKSDPGPFGMPEEVFFSPILSSTLRVLAHGKPQNALKSAPFETESRSQRGQKRIFPKVFLDHLECSNKCLQPFWSPW